MKTHILSMFWILDKKATPFLKLKTKGEYKYIPLKKGVNINIKKDFGRFCVGYFKDNKYYECPNNAKIDYGYKCNECLKRDDYIKCAKCNGTICYANENIKNICLNSTYFLYITLIGTILKVGISRSNRYLRRWIEQGSDYSTIIGSGNGREVRLIEKKISKEITDRIKTKTKIKMLFEDKKEILEKYLSDKKIDSKIINVRKYYEGLNNIPKDIEETNSLIGEIISVKGKLIVLRRNNKYYLFDANNILSHIVDIELKK